MNPRLALIAARNLTPEAPANRNPSPLSPIQRYRWLVWSVAAGLLFSHAADAQPANEPLEQFVVTDGLVRTTAKNGNVLYFGGSFTQAGVRSGSGVPTSATTGQAEASFPSVNGDVFAAIGDGQGGWFVGGSFSVVGGFLRTNLVHIKGDRTVDQAWSPVAMGGTVYTLLLTNGTLYFGGALTNANGQARTGAAAVEAASGTLLGLKQAS